MKKRKVPNNYNYYNILFRYIFLAVIGIGNLWIIYKVLTPLTIYPVFYILKLFYSTNISGISIIVDNVTINLIESCIAGSAYYLILILNLSTPMENKKRLYSLIYLFAVFLGFNIIRIIVLSSLFLSNYQFFDITHKFFWYGLSTIFVVIIWFSAIYIFEIKEIPIYSDVNYFMKYIKNK
ncbi:MAG: pacearchaeosortase [Candidatus Pacearchaeota archaeon]